jgi:hypothetical protein
MFKRIYNRIRNNNTVDNNDYDSINDYVNNHISMTNNIRDVNIDREIENNFLKQEIYNLKKELLYQKECNNKNNIIFRNLTLKDITQKDKTIIILHEAIMKKTQEIKQLTDNINSLKEEYEYTNKYVCCICINNPKNILIHPCNHLCCCLECYNTSNITNCPICRIPINVVSKIYL